MSQCLIGSNYSASRKKIRFLQTSSIHSTINGNYCGVLSFSKFDPIPELWSSKWGPPVSNCVKKASIGTCFEISPFEFKFWIIFIQWGIVVGHITCCEFLIRRRIIGPLWGFRMPWSRWWCLFLTPRYRFYTQRDIWLFSPDSVLCNEAYNYPNLHGNSTSVSTVGFSDTLITMAMSVFYSVQPILHPLRYLTITDSILCNETYNFPYLHDNSTYVSIVGFSDALITMVMSVVLHATYFAHCEIFYYFHLTPSCVMRHTITMFIFKITFVLIFKQNFTEE